MESLPDIRGDLDHAIAGAEDNRTDATPIPLPGKEGPVGATPITLPQMRIQPEEEEGLPPEPSDLDHASSPEEMLKTAEDNSLQGQLPKVRGDLDQAIAGVDDGRHDATPITLPGPQATADTTPITLPGKDAQSAGDRPSDTPAALPLKKAPDLRDQIPGAQAPSGMGGGLPDGLGGGLPGDMGGGMPGGLGGGLPGDMGGGIPGGLGGGLPGDMGGGMPGGMGGKAPGGTGGGQPGGGSTPGDGGLGGTSGSEFTGHTPDGTGSQHEDSGFGGGAGEGGCGGTTVTREAGFVNVSDLPADMQEEWHDAEADTLDNFIDEQADQLLHAKDPNVPGVKGENVPESELFAPPMGASEGGDENENEGGEDSEDEDPSNGGSDGEDELTPGDEGSGGGGEKTPAIEDHNWSKVDGLLAVDPRSPEDGGGGSGSGFTPTAAAVETTTTEEGAGGASANPNAAKKFDPSVITDPDQE